MSRKEENMIAGVKELFRDETTEVKRKRNFQDALIRLNGWYSKLELIIEWEDQNKKDVEKMA